VAVGALQLSPTQPLYPERAEINPGASATRFDLGSSTHHLREVKSDYSQKSRDNLLQYNYFEFR
jgi:hypothetical protein